MTMTTGGSALLAGCPPRWGTPRDPGRASLGPQVAEVAKRLGKPLMPWQEQVVDVALELQQDPESGLWVPAYDELDLTVPRQSGKTTLIMAKAVHRLTVWARALGERQTLTYTAQTRLKAKAKLEREFAERLRGSKSFREVPHSRARPGRANEWRLSLNNGQEHIQIGKSLWLIDAPTRDAGHGDTLDEGHIDEAFAHQDDEVEGGLRPAQATRSTAQLVVLSTAGDEKSAYLYRKVLAGRAARDAGGPSRVAYFEWSAPDDADPADPATWRACSPALGITISERFLQSEWERAQRKGQEGVDTFRRAYLNQWPNPPILSDVLDEVVPEELWAACMDRSSPLQAGIGAPVWVAVDVTPDQSTAAIAVAAVLDGKAHVAVVDERPGTRWVAGRCRDLRDRYNVVGWSIDPASPAGALLPQLADAGIEPDLIAGRAMAAACAAFYDLVRDGQLVHHGQPSLTSAVRHAKKRPLGDAWAWARKDTSVSIAPLVAVTLAAWGAAQPVEEPAALVSFFAY